MKKIIKFIFICSIILFFLVFINRNNYYDNERILTEESIKRFEKDLSKGKTINPRNYLTEKKNYNNHLSIFSMKISNTIEKIVNKSLIKVLNYIEP